MLILRNIFMSNFQMFSTPTFDIEPLVLTACRPNAMHSVPACVHPPKKQSFRLFLWQYTIAIKTLRKDAHSCKRKVLKHSHSAPEVCTKQNSIWYGSCPLRVRSPTKLTLEIKRTYFSIGSFNFWSERRGSNPRQLPWQGSALPLSHSRKN